MMCSFPVVVFMDDINLPMAVHVYSGIYGSPDVDDIKANVSVVVYIDLYYGRSYVDDIKANVPVVVYIDLDCFPDLIIPKQTCQWFYTLIFMAFLTLLI